MPSVRRVILVAVVVAGCDTVQDRPDPTWSYMHAAIIQPSCATASCHSAITSVAGRDMSTTWTAYTVFTDRTCGGMLHGDADPSLEMARRDIIKVLYGIGTRTTTGTDDLLMPPDQPLNKSEIQLIERWYDNGAVCD